MSEDIKLTGGEISMLKALGLSGSAIHGKMLMDRIEMHDREFLDTLDGLINQGYVISTKVNVMKMEDVERANFRVNGAYGKDLREAIRPRKSRTQERRRRRG